MQTDSSHSVPGNLCFARHLLSYTAIFCGKNHWNPQDPRICRPSVGRTVIPVLPLHLNLHVTITPSEFIISLLPPSPTPPHKTTSQIPHTHEHNHSRPEGVACIRRTPDPPHNLPAAVGKRPDQTRHTTAKHCRLRSHQSLRNTSPTTPRQPLRPLP